jgi:UDPglucose--hexose-1-phosphate uridylyltransferase
MAGDRCEVVLYTSDHDASLPSLGVGGVRKVVDLWAARTVELGRRDDVDFVLVFENRGPEVGATIAHPHGQIYAYDHVPERPARLFASPWQPDGDPGDRAVATSAGWHAYVPFAPTYPVALTITPTHRVPDLAGLDDVGRDGLAAILVDCLSRLDRLYDQPLPYMLWLMQRPTTVTAAVDFPEAWMQIEIVSPWRAAGVARFIAAAEVACAEFFNPVGPEELAERLRRIA